MCHRINRLNDTRGAFTICDTKLDVKNGLTYEMTANVPVANDFRVIGRLLWSRGVKDRGPLTIRSLHPLERTTQVRIFLSCNAHATCFAVRVTNHRCLTLLYVEPSRARRPREARGDDRAQ